jgi:hypothetical protein
MVVVALAEPSVPVTTGWFPAADPLGCCAVAAAAPRAERKNARALAVLAIVMSIDSDVLATAGCGA